MDDANTLKTLAEVKSCYDCPIALDVDPYPVCCKYNQDAKHGDIECLVQQLVNARYSQQENFHEEHLRTNHKCHQCKNNFNLILNPLREVECPQCGEYTPISRPRT